MVDHDLIVGVLETPGRTGHQHLERKLRDFTLALCRFDYRGPILESSSVDELLAAAARTGARHCLVQACGNAMVRHGDRRRASDTNLLQALGAWLPRRDFLVAGHLLDGGERWFGLDEICFLVNLDAYRALGRPGFTPAAAGPLPLPAAAWVEDTAGAGVVHRIERRLGTRPATPALPGWGLIAASLEAGKPVLGFDETSRHCSLDLRPKSAAEIESILRFSGAGIFDFDGSGGDRSLGESWRGFLGYVQNQAKHAKRGIFLGNFESYEDVERPPAGFAGPLSGLYAVAAGFKANRILHTHGFDSRTRMVFFDYSTLALDLRRTLVEEWDGADYPGFIQRISGRFPDAFYQLWGNLWAPRPGALDPALVGGIWERELAIWGGEAAFREHWSEYRQLRHHYVHCDLFADAAPLLAVLGSGPREAMWWSNAFHSLNSVWFYAREDRHRIYTRWLDDAAAINPGLLLYGTDADNLGLGGIRLDDHRARGAGPS
jgi:hypothetical protein